MTESLVTKIVALFGGKMLREAIIFIISLMPVLELRGGILAGYALGMELLPTFAVSYIGNILPVPFILLFIRFILDRMKRTSAKGIADFLEKKALSKKDNIEKYGYLGLFLFVAIPLPGTGAWTGSLLAALLHMDIKKSFFATALGVLTAGIIMSFLSFGLLNAIGIG